MKKHIREKLKEWGINHPRIWRLLTIGGGSLRVKGTGNQVINDAISLKGCSIKVLGNNNKIEIGKEVRMNNVDITITGDGHRLNIGKGVRFVEGGRVRMEDVANTIKIGEKTTIYNAFLSVGDKHTKIVIGRDCLFSVDVILRTSDSHSIFMTDGYSRINQGEDIILGDHVWLCNGVNVLKGVKIGDGAVVGTQSVVTKSISPQSIACGNPAKIVKTNIRWDEQRVYQ